MDETRRLADYVAHTGYRDLPGQVVEAARVYILDNLASGFVGSTTPWAGMVEAPWPGRAPLRVSALCLAVHGRPPLPGRPWSTAL